MEAMQISPFCLVAMRSRNHLIWKVICKGDGYEFCLRDYDCFGSEDLDSILLLQCLSVSFGFASMGLDFGRNFSLGL